jgi:hypothetical protein
VKDFGSKMYSDVSAFLLISSSGFHFLPLACFEVTPTANILVLCKSLFTFKNFIKRLNYSKHIRNWNSKYRLNWNFDLQIVAMTNVTLSMLNEAIKKAEDKMKLLFVNRIKNLEEMLEAEKKKSIKMKTKNKSLEKNYIKWNKNLFIEWKIVCGNTKKKAVRNQILIANTIEQENKRRRE